MVLHVLYHVAHKGLRKQRFDLYKKTKIDIHLICKKYSMSHSIQKFAHNIKPWMFFFCNFNRHEYIVTMFLIDKFYFLWNIMTWREGLENLDIWLNNTELEDVYIPNAVDILQMVSLKKIGALPSLPMISSQCI